MIPGRGINLFKALRRIFRALAGADGLVDAVVDRVADPRALTRGERGDKGRDPGRGINLFKALRRIFRAFAGAGGFVDAVVDRVADPRALTRGSAATRVETPGADSTFSTVCAGFSGRSPRRGLGGDGLIVLQPKVRAAEKRRAERGGFFAVIEPRVPGCDSGMIRGEASGRAHSAARAPP